MQSLSGKVRGRYRRLARHRLRHRAGARRRRASRSRLPVSTTRILAEARRKLDVGAPDAWRRAAPTCESTQTSTPAIGAAVTRFGGLDILVNNAGVGIFTNVADMTPAQWAEVIDTNLTGVFNACHAALPHLRRRGGGFIINISSLSGKNPFAGAAAYCASKAGLNAFSEALMQEVRYDGIRVSYVMPGSVATGFGGGDPRRATTGRSRRTKWPKSSSTCCGTTRAACRAASSCGRRSRRGSERAGMSEDIHIRQAPRHARAPRNDDGDRARPSGRRARSADRFAGARGPARRVLPQRTVSRASRAWTSRSSSSSSTMRSSWCRARWRSCAAKRSARSRRAIIMIETLGQYKILEPARRRIARATSIRARDTRRRTDRRDHGRDAIGSRRIRSPRTISPRRPGGGGRVAPEHRDAL